MTAAAHRETRMKIADEGLPRRLEAMTPSGAPSCHGVVSVASDRSRTALRRQAADICDPVFQKRSRQQFHPRTRTFGSWGTERELGDLIRSVLWKNSRS